MAGGSVQCLAFSGDSSLLAAGSDGAIQVWDAASGRKRKTLRDFCATADCLAFGPDGQTLASGHWEPIVNVWDLATGKVRASFPAHTVSSCSNRHDILCVAIHPDGKTLAAGILNADYESATPVQLWKLTGIKPRNP